MVLLMNALLQKIHNDDRAQTLEALTNTQAALTEYVGNNLRYPCPADPALAPGNPMYGFEQVDAAGTCTISAQANGYRGNDIDPVTKKGRLDTVYFGAVPFNTINAPPGLTYTRFTGADTIDGWNDKLGYAVTGSLTKTLTFNDKHGAIEVWDENKQSLLQPSSSAHLVVYSFGRNGRGAHTRDGGVGLDCSVSANPAKVNPPPKGVTAPESEWENCDNVDNVFLSGLDSESDPNTFDDDYVKFLSVKNGNFWNITGCVNNDCTNNPIIYKVQNTNSGNVGVGVENPGQKLDVLGGMFVQGGNIQTAYFCNQTGDSTDPTNAVKGSYCFQPDLIGGNNPNMDCASQGANMVMTGISQNKATCAPVVFPQKNYTCPAGQFLVSISNLGNFVCQ